MTRPTLPRAASFGAEKAGVRYATPPRHDLRAHVGAYAPTGCENAPLVSVDEHGRRWTLSRVAGEAALVLGYAAGAYALWTVAAVLL